MKQTFFFKSKYDEIREVIAIDVTTARDQLRETFCDDDWDMYWELYFPRLTMSAMWTEQLGDLIKNRAFDPFPIKFGSMSADFFVIQQAVNIGIDSHLEAVWFTQQGNTFVFKPESLHTLIRRLMTHEFKEIEGEYHNGIWHEGYSSEELYDEAHSLASSICAIAFNIELI